MDGGDSALLGRIREARGLYEALGGLIGEERRAVMDGDYEGLYAVLAKKEAVLSAMEALSEGLSVPLGRLALEASAGGEGELAREAAGLLGEMEAVRELNRRSERLIRASLQRVNRSLEFLRTLLGTGVYGTGGGLGALAAKGARLDRGA